MKLEDQVVSLELSKQLKELGVKQESLFYWEIDLQNKWRLFFEDGSPRMNPNASAFTVAELGQLLPSTLELDSLQIFKDPEWSSDWVVQYGLFGELPSGETFKPKVFFGDESLANACAKMLIYLITQRIIKS